MQMEKQKTLYTPGPLCTSATVKQAMQIDVGTRDQEYANIIEQLQMDLLQLAEVSPEDFALVLLQGSGTYGVESVLTSTIGDKEKVMILANGAYGKRMEEIAIRGKLAYEMHCFSMLESLPLDEVEQLIANSDCTHVAFVHDETTAGVLNACEAICAIAKNYHKVTIVDAMSSFGGIPIDFHCIDYLITSSNKCLHGVPGCAIIFARHKEIQKCAGKSKSLCLDLYAQYKSFQEGKSFRYTSPTHVLLALTQAIHELQAQGGIAKRYERYQHLHQRIKNFMREEGFQTLVKDAMQAPIITTFAIPAGFDFEDFYQAMKRADILLYSGKLPNMDAFRIGNIGELTDKDIDTLKACVHAYRKGECL